MYNLDKILEKNEILIKKAIDYMNTITDFEHNIKHVEDVLYFLLKLMYNIEEQFDPEVCVISAYWHDVGRTVQNDGHEKISAEMLKEEMNNLGYDPVLIDKCYDAIIFHKWNMDPKTIEGKILKDVDKIGWLGKGRWTECLNNNQNLDNIIKLLPKLRNEILFFEYSKKLYDEAVVEIFQLIYKFTKK
jgi:Predicted HD superfamily hydrolase